MSRYNEIPNRCPIFSNTDTDTDVGILNTENTELQMLIAWLIVISDLRFAHHCLLHYVTSETGSLHFAVLFCIV